MKTYASILRSAALGSLLTTTACTAPEAPEKTGPVDLRVKLEEPEFGYQLASEPYIVQPGEEVQKCDVVKIEPKDGEKLIWLSAFESRTSTYTHHMNVLGGYFSVLDAIVGKGAGEAMLGKKIGQYDCEELGDLMNDQSAQPLYPS